MITTNIPTNTSTTSALNAKVDIYNGATLVATCTCSENLQDFVLHREGDSSKFFGFGVSHKLDASFIDIYRGDPERELPAIEKGYTVKVALGSGTNFDYPYPTLYIVEVARNEKTNNITCVAYDLLAKSSAHTVSELEIAYPASISTIASNCASLIGLSNVSFTGVEASLTAQEFDELNFNGEEPVKVLLDAIAEFTQTIYYINNQNVLVFKRLDKDGEPVLEVSKEKYFELTTLTPRTITGVCHATELGDNLTTSDESGVIQIMRDNPLYSNNPNIATLLEEAAARVSGLTITQLEGEWDGNHCLEVGDKIAFVTEDDNTVNTYILNDVIEYQGFLNEITSWEYTQDEDETAANPTNIGDKINQTIAKVDKVNKEITLLITDIDSKIEESIDKALEDFVPPDNKEYIDEQIRIVTETINEKEATINLTIDGIDQRVTDNESKTTILENSLNEVISTTTEHSTKIGALEVSTENITASVSAVDRKVETYKTEATTDATNKANTAETNAKDYTDEKITVVNETITTKEAAIKVTTDAIEQRVAAEETKTTEIQNDLGEVVESVDTNTTKIGQLEVTSSSIVASVSAVSQELSRIENQTIDLSNQTSNKLNTLTQEVALKLDKEGVEITVESKLAEGVDKVKTTSKNYTFDDNGLNIESSESEIRTTISEDGMRVYKNAHEVLSADNTGVIAEDLHARTFLIIGENSRLQDRGRRTLCFWIGAAEE